MSDVPEMVDRVAKAIYEDTDEGTLLLLYGRPAPTWEQVRERTKRGEFVPLVLEMFFLRARVVIAAMREPTPTMIERANNTVRADSDNMQCPDWYRAAIDGALQP